MNYMIEPYTKGIESLIRQGKKYVDRAAAMSAANNEMAANTMLRSAAVHFNRAYRVATQIPDAAHRKLVLSKLAPLMAQFGSLQRESPVPTAQGMASMPRGGGGLLVIGLVALGVYLLLSRAE